MIRLSYFYILLKIQDPQRATVRTSISSASSIVYGYRQKEQQKAAPDHI